MSSPTVELRPAAPGAASGDRIRLESLPVADPEVSGDDPAVLGSWDTHAGES
jgi:hypothetical protein